MSLILDALNRTRQDENAVPGLATHHPLEQLTARRRQHLLWVALALAVAVIAALVIDRFRAPPDVSDDIGAPVAELSRNIGSAVNSVTTELKARAEAAEQAQASTPAPVAGPQPAAAQQSMEPAAAPAIAAAPPVSAPSVAAPPVESRPADSLSVSSPPDAPVALPAAPPAVPDEAVAELYQNRDLEDVPVKREPASPAQPRREELAGADVQSSREVERILQQAREEMENASLDEHPAPFLADLSQRTKDGIPTLYYQRHDYSSNGSQSSVTLNGNTVGTGGSVMPGMKVEEILPDSVVLNYQGTQFRLRALNSWVNL